MPYTFPGLPQNPLFVKGLPPPLPDRTPSVLGVLGMGWEAKGVRQSESKLTSFCVGSPLKPSWPVAATQRHGGSS